jgi:deoxyribodipyrimidine photo-lyase
VPETTLVWLQRDLRLADNPALHAAAHASDRVIPVFIWSPDDHGAWSPGRASRWYISESLRALDSELRDRGSRIILRAGPAREVLSELVDEIGADAVYWNDRPDPELRIRDASIADDLKARGTSVMRFPGFLLHDPDTVQTTTGGYYGVFSPFWKRLQGEIRDLELLPTPELGHLNPDAWPESLSAETLFPDNSFPDLSAFWTPGERAAHRRLESFCDETIFAYHADRDRPDVDGTSLMSVCLAVGEVSVAQVWNAALDAGRNRRDLRGPDAFRRELAWREFSYHLLHHRPETVTDPLNQSFSSFPWLSDEEMFDRWKHGETGYPIVDAGMRQLATTGWIHNRVRMVVASFLTKHLLIPWQDGSRVFWEGLVDADLANNTMGWQWTAGSGADAQPYFRIFNPILQGRKFDPEGIYVRRYVPELAGLPDRWIHTPWEAPPMDLLAAGITLGETYPRPIVEHAAARERALEAYQTVRNS